MLASKTPITLKLGLDDVQKLKITVDAVLGGAMDELPGPSPLSRERKGGEFVLPYDALIMIVDASYTDRFERALKSARETLKRARHNFQSSAIAAEQKGLFGYGLKKSTKGSTKRKPARVPGRSSSIVWHTVIRIMFPLQMTNWMSSIMLVLESRKSQYPT